MTCRHSKRLMGPPFCRSETNLAGAFEYVVSLLKRECRLPLTYIALDWHEMDRRLGTETLISAFWSTVKDILPEHGFALGQMSKAAPDYSDLLTAAEPGLSANDPAGQSHTTGATHCNW